ncbi:MAG: hypothetical protein ACRD0C_02885 [Acidimicrobiia bacterium]
MFSSSAREEWAEAIYEHIGLARRRILHRQIGRALLDTGSLSEAAPHYARSAETGDSDAIEVLCDAIRQAEEREAYREVLGVLGELVELLPSGDPRWVTVGDAMSLQADWIVERRADASARLAIRALREIDGQSDDSIDPARRAAIKFRLATFLSWGVGKLDEAEPPCREASRLFEQAGDTAQALLADNELAWIRVLRWHDLATFQRDEADILERADAADAELAVAQARYSLAITAMWRGRFAEANAAFETSIAVAQAAGKIPHVSRALAMFAMSLAHEGRLPEAQSHLEEAKAINPAYRDTPLLEWGTVVLGEAGDLAGAIRSAEEALAWSPQGVSRRRAVGMACATLAAAETGRLADAHRFLALGRAAFGDSGWLLYSDHMDYAGGMLAWREGRPAEALSVIRQAAERLLGVGALPLAAHALVDLAAIAGMSGDTRTVAEAAGRLAEIAVRLDRRLYHGLAAMAAAWSAAAVGRTTTRSPRPSRQSSCSRRPAVGCFSDELWNYSAEQSRISTLKLQAGPSVEPPRSSTAVVPSGGESELGWRGRRSKTLAHDGGMPRLPRLRPGRAQQVHAAAVFVVTRMLMRPHIRWSHSAVPSG